MTETSSYRVVEMLKKIEGLLINKPKMDKWLDISQASEYTAMSKSTLRRNVKDGKLIASNQTGKLLFKQSELENWLTNA